MTRITGADPCGPQAFSNLVGRSILHVPIFAECNIAGKPILRRSVCSVRDDQGRDAAHNVCMAKDPEKNYLKAWREHRRMTQEQLSQAVGTTASVISLIESGERGLSSKWLRKLAPALNTTPGFLLDHHPDDLDTDLVRIASRVPKDQQRQAVLVLEALLKAG